MNLKILLICFVSFSNICASNPIPNVNNNGEQFSIIKNALGLNVLGPLSEYINEKLNLVIKCGVGNRNTLFALQTKQTYINICFH